jgi:uncharacterized protein
MKDFRYSFFVTIVCLAAAYYWGSQSVAGGLAVEAGLAALFLCLILSVMEVSLSFDNAVVNASVLKDMSPIWRQIFLTIGILIAVFGMRLFFPIVIVAVATGLDMSEVTDMALSDPDEYSKHLLANNAAIAAFGGMFLLLVFLSFLFNAARELHWLGVVEEKLARLGKVDSFSIMVALVTLFSLQHFLPIDDATRLTVMTAGLAGVILHVAVSSLDSLFESEEEGEAAVETAKRSGIAGFLYLEVLDASFSFDGVIGAFAITRDVVIIMLGLAIGAMFVRSMTVHLVKKGTLDEYVFLEHGAHYAIGALAAIMLASIVYHTPEVITGLIGVAFIILSLISSIRYKRRLATEEGYGLEPAMALTLVKGGNLSLTPATPNLKRILVGLGWDARTTAGDDFDLDASVFMVGGNGKVRRDEDFIFYHRLQSRCGAVKHTGDNRTGASEGDDEAIEVALEKVPDDIQRLVVCVTIYDADVRRQNFGQMTGAFIRLVNLDNDQEIVRFDLAEEYGTETAMIFGEIYRHGREWKFKAVRRGLEALCRQFGVNVA